jgi:hypothetical protein
MALAVPSMVQLPRTPDIEAQRAAMKKLDFLVGKWSGEARVLRGPGEPLELIQTEEAQYKLDGLILVIEAVGKTKVDGKDRASGFRRSCLTMTSREPTRMRAYNDGRYLETDVKLSENGRGMTWGFALGDIRTRSTLRINEKGEWTELAEITIGSQPARKLIELAVSREK